MEEVRLTPNIVHKCLTFKTKSNTMKKTLIIHPADTSTDFLKPIYDKIQYKTVITGGVTPDVIMKEIENHDRIFMMGHGCPSGLFSMGRFPKAYGMVIDSETVELLKQKECVFIWCNADQFVKTHDLKGFYSGMFISEVEEADYCGFPETTQKEVTESNNSFAKILGEHSNKSIENMFEETKKKYKVLAESSNVARYNYERLYCNTEKTILEEVK